METGDLITLLSFQATFASYVANGVNAALSTGCQNACDHLNTQVSQIENANTVNGNGVLLDILSGICGLVGAVATPLEIPCAVLAAVIGVVQNYVPGGGPIGGDLSDKENAVITSLNSAVNTINTQAANLYATICSDWGKLQQFIALNQKGLLPGTGNPDYGTIADQFEISLYQMLFPSIAAIVTGGPYGTVLAALPTKGSHPAPVGLYDKNGQGAVWDRLTNPASQQGLAVPSSAILGRQGGWASLPAWSATVNGGSCPTTYYYQPA